MVIRGYSNLFRELHPAKCCCAPSCVVNRSGQPNQHHTLSTTSDHYKLDAPITVMITLTNTGQVPMHLRVYGVPDGAYQSLGLQFSLTLDANKVPRTAFHRAIRGESLRDESLRGETSSGKSPSGNSGVIVD